MIPVSLGVSWVRGGSTTLASRSTSCCPSSSLSELCSSLSSAKGGDVEGLGGRFLLRLSFACWIGGLKKTTMQSVNFCLAKRLYSYTQINLCSDLLRSYQFCWNRAFLPQALQPTRKTVKCAFTSRKAMSVNSMSCKLNERTEYHFLEHRALKCALQHLPSALTYDQSGS